MIEPEKIRLAFQDLSEHLSGQLGQPIACVLADEAAEKPEYPFIQFRTIGQRRFGEHSVGIATSEIEGDPEHALQTEYLNLTATVSITVCHSESESAWAIAGAALDWFDSQSGIDACSAQDIFPRILNQSVQDRTTLIELSYEYRAGFDLQFETVRATENTVDAVDIEATAAGATLEKV